MKTINFKKTLCMLLVIVLACSLFGCKKDEAVDPTETTVVGGLEVTESVNAIEDTDAPTEEVVPEETEPTVPTAPAHVHDWVDIVTNPTCTEKGYTTHICSECNEKEIDSYVDAEGHAWNPWKTVTAPTETSAGKAERTCSVCAEVESRILAKLPANHTHSYTSTVTVEPTCSKTGVRTFVCSCGDKYTDDIAKIDHDYTEKEVESTCTLRGYTLHTCSVCGNSYKDKYTTVAKHVYEETVTEPTCTEKGYTTYKCKGCRDTYVSDYVSAKGHNWGAWKVLKDATITATGVKERTCLDCGEKESSVIDKIPHTCSYVDEVTNKAKCEVAGIITYTCKYCGDSYIAPIPATGHSWTNWTVTKAATEESTGIEERICVNCEKKESKVIDKIPHTHKYTSETTKAKCEAAGLTTYTCACGDSYIEPIPATGHSLTHVVTEPTCTTGGYTTHKCSNCDYSYVDTEVSATGHSWSDWNTVTAPTENATGKAERSCSSCGATESKTLDKLPHTHNYTSKVTTEAKCETAGVKTYTCTCGDSYTEAIPATGHSLTSIVTKPTCTNEGYTTHKCSICGYSAVDTKVPATGHSWSDWRTVTAPTEDAVGKAERTCSTCGTSETKTLDKLPHTHSYTKVVETVDSTCEKDGYVKKSCSCGDVKTEVIPAGHNWEHHHEDEVGHYDVRIVCHCGWSCSADGDYITAFTAHLESLPADERYDHSYYESTRWVVDTPAKDWDECTKCGATK